ncbi:MAG: 23S rRNA (guanine1835-N2)-methyltransferase [Halioglobus sp.]
MTKSIPSDTHFITSAGKFELQRYPSRKEEPLKAWNSADTLLVEQVLELGAERLSILVVNDDHGALAAALRPAGLWTDSALSIIAIHQNCVRNHFEVPAIISSIDTPSENFTVVAIKVPKQLSYFEYQLAQLNTVLRPGAVVVASGMDKHLSPKVAGLLEQYIGLTIRHRGKSKARCFSATRDARAPNNADQSSHHYYDKVLNGDLLSLPNVFSADKIDVGSRVLIKSFENLERSVHTIDLACGNGILGLSAMKKGLCSNLLLCDESAMAVESAQRNAVTLLPENIERINFHHGDGLVNYSGQQADLILCNPPFHANHAVEEYVGKRLLMQCAAHLGRSGRLCLVANRHLNYLPTLKRGFSRVDKLSDNGKFIAWLAQK